ncbi:MAG: phosphoglucomutase [Desulfurococcales archaeon]|nr:phosphoglucomutase [Desulfurococcales archaeon]
MGRLFGTAGIRGRYLEKVTPELAYKVGLAVASYVGQWGSATVGHDVRTTSPLLAQLAAAGLMAGGLDAIYLGVVPTPVLAYSVPHTRSRAGIVITASHNPPEDNGMKVFDQNGMEYTRSMEDELESIILGESHESLHAPWNRVGRLVQGTEVVEEYIRDLVDRATVPFPRYRPIVAVDCANGAASNVTPRVLREIGARVVSMNCHPDGFFPGRMPEPRPDVLRRYTEALPSLAVEALLAHDGDADRLALVLPVRGFVKQDLLIALFAMEKLREHRGTIIVSVDVGLEVEEVVEKMGGRIVRAKLGKTHEKLRETPSALMAAEPWKLIDPSWGPWVDGIYQAALLVKISMAEGAPLDRLIEKLPFYPSIRMSIRVASDSDKESLYSALREGLISGMNGEPVSVLELDGVRAEYRDRSWVLVRPSGTETKLRIYAQALERERLLDIIERIRRLVSEAAEARNIRIRGVEEQLNLDRATF